jgi:hypothetical protein
MDEANAGDILSLAGGFFIMFYHVLPSFPYSHEFT